MSNTASSNQPTEQTEVVILSTLHQFHAQTDFYTFNDLSRIIERLEPTALAVELTRKDIDTRREQGVKREYQESVCPLLDKHDYAVYPLEPDDPLFSELVKLFREAEGEFKEREPEKYGVLELYVRTMFEHLLELWDSPGAVNSVQTDLLIEVKHAFQEALYGPKEKRARAEWNGYFLAQILRAAREHPGGRVVVIVGFEHGYWLRKHLKDDASIRLLDTEGVLGHLSF